MAQISSSEDVYRICVDESEEGWLFGLVKFALIEEQRIEWMKHFELNNHGPASTDEILHWYQQLPDGVFLRANGTAENALVAFSTEVMEEVIEQELNEVKDGVIVDEIRLIGRFWPQFGINLAAGFASAVLFAAVLVLFAFFVLNDISPVEIGKELIGQ